MANKRRTKPKVSSKKKRRKPYSKLGYGQMNKNAKNVRRIIAAQEKEEE